MHAKKTDYLVTAKNGRALASFDTVGHAQSFRADRSRRNVATRLFKSVTTLVEISQ